MRQRRWPLLILIGILIVAGGVFLFKKLTLLHIENMDRAKTIHIRISPSETFSMFYIHSIYKEPVLEEFQVDHEAIILKGVRTKSPAIMEYYGFQESKEFHPMDLKLGAVFLIRRGMGEGQGLIVRDRKIYLSEIGEKGDRIRLRVESISLGKYLFSIVF
ncbi:MAG: hypothetical protein A2156_08590 [Deltaproteobacteria bacterium RBG_16_48_10]|nr:MAG: hypothetical protein A2156_08590 [Deltaproteobacteria bacterium RBG_16_48_10]